MTSETNQVEQGAASSTRSSSWMMLAGVVSLLATLAVYVLRLDGVVGLFTDDAWYVLLAKALATGQGYSIANSPTPGILPLYPPAFPFLLSLVFRLSPGFPENVWLLKSVSVAAMLAWIARSAPEDLKATYFAVMASFTNLALSASALGTKYLNQWHTVTREVKVPASLKNVSLRLRYMPQAQLLLASSAGRGFAAEADELLAALDTLPGWPDRVKAMQANWIGKSYGVRFAFPYTLDGKAEKLWVFTTRADTIMGVTFVTVAAEHPLAQRAAQNKPELAAFIAECRRGPVMEADLATMEKKGMATGIHVEHPLTGEKIEVWVGNYVLMGYGEGAVMGVPGHDERDWAFAKTYSLPIREVIAGGNVDKEAFVDTEKGTVVNSTAPGGTFSIDGLTPVQAIPKITAWLESQGKGRKAVNYKLRDWLFARQRYWGEPFPIVWINGDAKPLPEEQLPLALPETSNFKPSGTGESPLANLEEWLTTTDQASGQQARRETNTMPQWAGSCWYYLRFIDPRNSARLIDPEKERYWMPVDLYIGGSEHAVLHLLYSRFWHKVLFDIGVVTTPEPFKKLVHQGIVLGEDNQKMSKSRGNVVNPDEIMDQFGADAVRLYEMFMGPLEAMKPWSTRGVEGITRFLERVWRLMVTEDGTLSPAVVSTAPSLEHQRVLHQTIKKVTEDIEELRFNTAISQMMVFTNELTKAEQRPRAVLEPFVLLLSPFAPHLAEELWGILGHTPSVSQQPWPSFDPALTVSDRLTIPVQINGKLRGKIEAAGLAP